MYYDSCCVRYCNSPQGFIFFLLSLVLDSKTPKLRLGTRLACQKLHYSCDYAWTYVIEIGVTCTICANFLKIICLTLASILSCLAPQKRLQRWRSASFSHEKNHITGQKKTLRYKEFKSPNGFVSQGSPTPLVCQMTEQYISF